MPQDLTRHACINLRLPTLGSLYAWEFEKDERELKSRLGCTWMNSSILLVAAAFAAAGRSR